MDVHNAKKACTETLILRLLAERPMHGYEMAKEVGRRSKGYFEFKHGTLYPILHRLEKAGLIKGSWSTPEAGERPRKAYELTRAGRRYYEESTSAWREFFSALVALVPEVSA
jgi:DNA-binding PadR family transcriptional regulator